MIEPDIDTEQLKDMQKTLGPAFPQLVAITLESLDKNKTELDIAIAKQDMKAIHMSSHALGSSAGNLGLRTLHTTSRQIEAIAYDLVDAPENEFKEIQSLYAKIQGNFENSKKYLQSFL